VRRTIVLVPVLVVLLAPGCTTLFSLQEMPGRIWSIFEGFLDDAFYQEWRDKFGRDIHPDWDGRPRIPETILLLGPSAWPKMPVVESLSKERPPRSVPSLPWPV